MLWIACGRRVTHQAQDPTQQHLIHPWIQRRQGRQAKRWEDDLNRYLYNINKREQPRHNDHGLTNDTTWVQIASTRETWKSVEATFSVLSRRVPRRRRDLMPPPDDDLLCLQTLTATQHCCQPIGIQRSGRRGHRFYVGSVDLLFRTGKGHRVRLFCVSPPVHNQR